MNWRIGQDQAYHAFADSRPFLGIEHAANTLSNLPLLAVGILGLLFLWRDRHPGNSGRFAIPGDRRVYWALFAAVALTGIGSMYYHLAPDDARLVWDRLPISLGFTALLATMISERVGAKAGRSLLIPLLLFGAGSVVYWQWSASQGTESLVPYGIAQYGSILAIFVLAVTRRSRYTRGGDIFVVLGLYAAAKVAEMLDRPIFAFGEVVSGHTLKHLMAALAVWWLLRSLKSRVPNPVHRHRDP